MDRAEELRKWIAVAKRAIRSCTNPEVFQKVIEEQEKKLKQMEKSFDK